MPLIRVKACGRNSFGQLGDGTTINRSTPVQIPISVDAISAGGIIDTIDGNAHVGHSLAIKFDDTVWAWGANGNGQLGDNTLVDKSSPVQVSGLTGAIAVAAGSHHSLALKSDGTVWAWGYNYYGQLGDNTTVDKSTPVQVSGLTSVIAIAVGAGHSLALKSDGTVWAWGLNNVGQLGDNTTVNKSTPVQVSGLIDVTAIAAGGYRSSSGHPIFISHSLALTSDGTVWAWGNNGNGQLGDNTTVNKSTPVQVSGLIDVTAIAAGAAHSLALKSNGTVWAWGNNGNGQLGDNTITDRHTPVQVSGLTNVSAVDAGWNYSIALKFDGTVWAWGYNGYGQLGDNTTVDKHTSVQVLGVTGSNLISAGGGHTLFANATLALLFANPDGYPLSNDNLGQMLADSTLGPVGVDLYNGSEMSVNQVSVTRQNLPPDDTIEISSSSAPFVAEDPLPLNGIYANDQMIGTVYIRIQAPVFTGGGQPNQGVKTFNLHATSSPA